MKKIYYLFIAVMFIGLASCSSGKTEEEKARDRAEKMAEGILKSVTGKDVDIETTKDGESTNLKIKTEDGELNIGGNQKELPDDFPSDIYIVDGERSDIGIMGSEEGKMLTFKVTSDKDMEALKEEIKSNMEAWKNTMDMSTPEGVMLNYEKEESGTVTMTVSKEDDKSIVAYMITYKIK